MTIFRVIDIETTGTEPKDGAEVLELGWQDVVDTDPPGLIDWAYGTRLFSTFMPSPPEVRAVHHIDPAEVENRSYFVGTADMDATGSHPDFWVAHNADFERLFLGKHTESQPWICTYKAALRVWPDAPAHNNQTLRYWLSIDLDADRAHPPHRALPDAYVTAFILVELLKVASVEDMVRWSNEPRLLPKCPIGAQWRGKSWSVIEAGFLNWMLRQPDMDADLKWNAQNELNRRKEAQ